jgi:hypothetical protein
MAGVTKTNLQIGDSGTATQNFTLSVPAVPDGTVKLARGNHGATTQDVLTVDASGVVAAPQGSYGGLRLMTAQASTSGTVIDFTGIPSWAKRITVMFDGVSTSGTSLVQVQLGDSGGFEITGYTSTVFVTTTAPLVGVNTSTSGMLAAGSVGAATSFTGLMTIVLLNTSNSWVATCTTSRSDNGLYLTSTSRKSLSDTLTQVRITTVNGTDTFDAGSINIMYEG